jgi:hypothetical protein
VFDPDAASAKKAAVRRDSPPAGCFVPRKWTLQWSGPHIIASLRLEHDTYRVYHVNQKKFVTVAVDCLQLYHPFLEIPFSDVPQRRVPPPQPPRNFPTPMPKRILKGPLESSALHEGNLFLALLPDNVPEPVVLLRFIKLEGTSINAQWMGNWRPWPFLDDRMYKQTWLPCWYQPKTNEHYFKPKPENRVHYAFTNEMSLHPIALSDVIVFNFELRADLRLPREVADVAVLKYRTLIPSANKNMVRENPHGSRPKEPTFNISILAKPSPAYTLG